MGFPCPSPVNGCPRKAISPLYGHDTCQALTTFELMTLSKLAVVVQHQPLTETDECEISTSEKEKQHIHHMLDLQHSALQQKIFMQ